MGVQGLWDLLSPCAKRIDVESLAGQRVAVDASVWLHQFVKAMRDPETGEMVPNAHLLGTFRRVCKLLFYRVRPVFVFDGPAPELKQRTLQARKNARLLANERAERASRRVLTNYLRERAVGDLQQAAERKTLQVDRSKRLPSSGNAGEPPGERACVLRTGLDDALRDGENLSTHDGGDGPQSASDSQGSDSSGSAKRKEDIAWLERPDSFRSEDDALHEESDPEFDAAGEQSGEEEEVIEVPAMDDLDPETLLSLPPQMQKRITEQMHRQRRNDNRRQFLQRRSDASEFSELQLSTFLRNKESDKRLREAKLRAAAAERTLESAGDNESQQASKEPAIVPRRVSSEVGREYIFQEAKPEKGRRRENPFASAEAQFAAAVGSSGLPWEFFHAKYSLDPIQMISSHSAAGGKERDPPPSAARSVAKPDQPVLTVPTPVPSIAKHSDTHDYSAILPSIAGDTLQNEVTGEIGNQIAGAQRAALHHDVFPAGSTSPNLADDDAEDIQWIDGDGLDISPGGIEVGGSDAPVAGRDMRDAPLSYETAGGFFAADDSIQAQARAGEASAAGVDPQAIAPEGRALRREIDTHGLARARALGEELQGTGRNASTADEYVFVPARAGGKSYEGAPPVQLAVSPSEREALLEAQRRGAVASDGPTEIMAAELRALLDALGVPILEAPSEAEAQCAALELAGAVDAVVTDDSDALLFGARRVVRRAFDSRHFAERVVAADVEAAMDLSRERLAHLALLLGSDYTPGVRGVGIVNAMEVLSVFRGLDGLRAFREWVEASTEPRNPPGGIAADVNGYNARGVRVDAFTAFTASHSGARRHWDVPPDFPAPEVVSAYLEPGVLDEVPEFTWRVPDIVRLVPLCEEAFGWKADQTTREIRPVLDALEHLARATPRIDRFFVVEPVPAASIRSKRLRTTVDDARQRAGKRSAQAERDAEQCDRKEAEDTSEPDRRCRVGDGPGFAGETATELATSHQSVRVTEKTVAAPKRQRRRRQR